MTDFYVDGAAASSGNGSSWASPWKGLSNISWGAVRPGDTVYISGGVNGETYAGQALNIGASGAPGAPITIEPGIDPGHNGAVTLDGLLKVVDTVSDIGHNYVDVKGLNVWNDAGAAFQVRNVTAGVVIEGNSVFSGDPGGNRDARGFDVRNAVGENAVIVRNNSYDTPVGSVAAQTDGIYSMDNNGAVFEGNLIVISNTDVSDHSDGIQSYQDKGVTIAGNYVFQNNAASNNHGMWITDIAAGGAISVYNNVINMPAGAAYALGDDNQDAGWTGRALIYNNTIYGGLYGVGVWNSPNTWVYNNIIEPVTSNATGVAIIGAAPPAANIDHNLIWPENGAKLASVDSATKTWAQWQVLGYDRNGVSANPQFINPSAGEFKLQSTSPTIDRGATIPSVGADISGVSRPQGAAYDIGAYEYVPSNGDSPTGGVTGVSLVSPRPSFLYGSYPTA